jgi:hypothetical protein
MKIKRGIMFHNSFLDRSELITINSGVIHHTEQLQEEINFNGIVFKPNFDENAYLPKRDWRTLTSRETNIIQSNNKRNDSNTIYLGEIPDDLKKLYQNLKISDCNNRDEVFEKFRENEKATIELNSLMEAFLMTLSNNKPFKIHFLGSNFPNLEVVACDTTFLPKGYTEKDLKFLGIHNDGTQYVSTYKLNTSGNRLTINLGNQDRYFYFINITLTQALNMLKEKISIKDYEIDITNIAKYFFKYFPDYPVIKIKQKPYHYYIAPTDNCFHDGSTLGNTTLDVIIVYFGAFQF